MHRVEHSTSGIGQPHGIVRKSVIVLIFCSIAISIVALYDLYRQKEVRKRLETFSVTENWLALDRPLPEIPTGKLRFEGIDTRNPRAIRLLHEAVGGKSNCENLYIESCIVSFEFLSVISGDNESTSVSDVSFFNCVFSSESASLPRQVPWHGVERVLVDQGESSSLELRQLFDACRLMFPNAVISVYLNPMVNGGLDKDPTLVELQQRILADPLARLR